MSAVYLVKKAGDFFSSFYGTGSELAYIRFVFGGFQT